MKKLITLLLMFTLCSVLTYGQNSKGQSNNIAFIQSPGSYDDGFSFGIQYEYQNKIVYVGPEFFMFPHLNDDAFNRDLTYIHLITRVGLNKEWGRFNKFRLFLGPRLGFIYRDRHFGYVLLGFEAGMQYTFRNGFYIQTAVTSDNKTDAAIWNDEYHTVNSGIVSLGIRF